MRGRLDDPGARVVVLVDPVAEPHQPGAAGLHPPDELRNVGHVADLAQHPQHRLVGAAVQRAEQRPDAGRHAGVGAVAGGGHGAHGGRRTVLLVVGVQDEQHLQGMDQPRVGAVVTLAHHEQHPHEVLHIGDVVARIDEGQTGGVPVGERRQGRHLGDQPADLQVRAEVQVGLARLRVEGVQ
ncbi:hypothetical protein SDC9_113784 [bioreactor metagenome]|uniref:Uncharacterized protein n=1 Tax=bioreactor metagenome TaxID=1076179 RepID=A0A645BNW9_9ZZZZ